MLCLGVLCFYCPLKYVDEQVEIYFSAFVFPLLPYRQANSLFGRSFEEGKL